jgi:hypothetical protein
MVQSKPRIAWSKDADRLRREFIRAGAAPVFEALDAWLAANDHLWVKGIVVDDPESEEPWRELVVQVAVDADDDQARQLRRDVANAIQNVERALDDTLRERLATDFGVQVRWGAALSAPT